MDAYASASSRSARRGALGRRVDEVAIDRGPAQRFVADGQDTEVGGVGYGELRQERDAQSASDVGRGRRYVGLHGHPAAHPGRGECLIHQIAAAGSRREVDEFLISEQWGPDPLRTTQLAFAAALIVCLAMALATPETVDRQPAAETRPSRFGLRPGGRAGFASGAALGVFSFAVLGLVTAMGAVILHTELGVSSPFVAGLAPFLMFGWSAAGLLILWRLSLARMLVTGAVVFPLGLALVALSLLHPFCGCTSSPSRSPA